MSKRGRPKHPDVLTPREWEVLDHIREGLSNDEIAEQLGISVDGVKYHVSEILGKLDLENRHDAARWADEGSPRPWWAGALAPLTFWRHHAGWLANAVAGGLLVLVAAGIGLLIWALIATRGGEDLTIQIAPVRLAAGASHTCVVTEGGGAKCWGDNEYGQLGDGTNEERTTPVDVVGLNSEVVAITAGDTHSCALLATGQVKCWGDNRAGRLGIDWTASTSSNVPVDVSGLKGPVTSVSAGDDDTCVVSRGDVICWGGNQFAEVGLGDTLWRPDNRSPVEQLNGAAISVSAGSNFTCALMATRTVECWGSNSVGQIGDGGLGNTRSNRLLLEPATVLNREREPLSDVQWLGAGGIHACAVSAGTTSCWGSKVWCETGDGNCGEGKYSSNVAVNTLGLEANTIGLSAGGIDSQGGHSCAIDVEGVVHCWGRGYSGQLGDGSQVGPNCCVPDRPVEVIGLDAPAVAVAAGGRHSCALLENNDIACWGDNEYGQLGTFAATQSSTPVLVTRLGR